MVAALVSDFEAAGLSPVTLCDSRLTPFTDEFEWVQPNELKSALERVAESVDWILLIAPESEGCLSQVCRWVEPWKGKLVSPGLDFIQITSSKNLTSQYLEQGGVPVPQPWKPADGNIWRVAKPVYGAGSEGIVRLSPDAAGSFDQAKYRIEHFVNGRPASVSVLCGRHGFTLSPTWQVLDGPCGEYLTSKAIECQATTKRARTLAMRAIDCLPPTQGYVGVDMILGEQDCVVDVNPRMTTSYCVVREFEPFNIAEKMLQLMESTEPI